jgi:hypothetical protein
VEAAMRSRIVSVLQQIYNDWRILNNVSLKADAILRKQLRKLSGLPLIVEQLGRKRN